VFAVECYRWADSPVHPMPVCASMRPGSKAEFDILACREVDHCAVPIDVCARDRGHDMLAGVEQDRRVDRRLEQTLRSVQPDAKDARRLPSETSNGTDTQTCTATREPGSNACLVGACRRTRTQRVAGAGHLDPRAGALIGKRPNLERGSHVRQSFDGRHEALHKRTLEDCLKQGHDRNAHRHQLCSAQTQTSRRASGDRDRCPTRFRRAAVGFATGARTYPKRPTI
jgi:hypothetical protein